MSNWREQIKIWYEMGVWNRKRVTDAVAKGKITEEEASEILGAE